MSRNKQIAEHNATMARLAHKAESADADKLYGLAQAARVFDADQMYRVIKKAKSAETKSAATETLRTAVLANLRSRTINED